MLHVASLLWWGTCWIRVRPEITELRQLGFDVEMIYSTNILSLKADLLKGANNSFTISTKIRCYNCHEIPQFPLESLPLVPKRTWESHNHLHVLTVWLKPVYWEHHTCELCFIWFPLWRQKEPLTSYCDVIYVNMTSRLHHRSLHWLVNSLAITSSLWNLMV